MRKALIEVATARVVNVISIEQDSDWRVPEGHFLRDAENAAPGDLWTGSRFQKPPLTEEEEAVVRRGEAAQRALQAIAANRTTAPWGAILYDFAVGQGLIDP